MAEARLFELLLITELALAPVVLVSLFFIVAPYGRHTRPGWGMTLPCRLGWVVMESPALLVFAWFFATGPGAWNTAPLGMASLWVGHYFYRTFVYPALLKAGARPMPLAVVVSGVVFNCLNGFINGYWLSHRMPVTSASTDVLLMVGGSALFLAGFMIHVHSDAVVRSLRRPGTSTYEIPQRGLHRAVASPNYLGEIVQWFGFALASRSPAALAFALFTVANLLPRSVANLRWYRETFPDYPKGRRALIPWLF